MSEETATVNFPEAPATHDGNAYISSIIWISGVGWRGPQPNSLAGRTTTSFDIVGNTGDKIHWEVRATYSAAPSDPQVLPIAAGDVTLGQLASPTNLKVAFEAVPIRGSIGCVIGGIGPAEGHSDHGSLEGQFRLPFSRLEGLWQLIVPAGHESDTFTISVSYEGAGLFGGFITHSLDGPIGGGGGFHLLDTLPIDSNVNYTPGTMTIIP